MTTYRDALTRAVEAAAAPGRRSVIDALTDSNATCTACHDTGGLPRQWDTPHGPAKGWFCDGCEAAVRRARVYLRAGRVTKACQEIQRVAS